jgi:hypothetical protein
MSALMDETGKWPDVVMKAKGWGIPYTGDDPEKIEWGMVQGRRLHCAG